MDFSIVGIIIGVVSAVAAVAAAIVAWVGARKAEKIGEAQQKVATHSAASEWRRDLTTWASEAIDLLAEASYTCTHADKTGEDCQSQLRSCRHRLSALIDRGRLYLPNQDVEKVGTDKPTAYRGWRHAGLDPLVAAERVISGDVGSGRFSTRGAALIEMRREFVSGIQRILAPDSYNREIAQLIQGSGHRADDKTLGGLLPDDNVVPTGANRLLFDHKETRQLPSLPAV